MYPGEEEFSGNEPTTDEFNEEEWEQVVKKCKVVNVDDSTVIIKNCTAADLEKNPYATSQSEKLQDMDVEEPNEELHDAGHEIDRRMDRGLPPPPYNPYEYNPYSYYQPPPPPMDYYGYNYYAQPSGDPGYDYNYNYYARPGPVRGGRGKPRKDSADPIRPYYYDNYGEGDDIWSDEKPEEKELLEKGFVKVEEKKFLEDGEEKMEETNIF